MNMELIFQIALTFFLVTNPIGNSPAIIALVKDFDFSRQKWIMFREGLIALAIALFFQYLAKGFLDLIGVEKYAVTLCGGVLLFLVAFYMIFTEPEKPEKASSKLEPFIVPIATPILSGPGLLAIIMLKAQEVQNHLIITLAILIAWIGVLLIMWGAPYLQKLLGRRGMIALEQLMGLVLTLIATDMFVRGMTLFMQTLHTGTPAS
jgi:multiple antibiotic resistance protein